MIGILIAKCKMFIRKPWTFLIFTGMSILFALLIGGAGNINSLQVPIYAEDDRIREGYIGEQIEELDAISVNWMNQEEMEEQIKNGKAEFGVVLEPDQFKLVVGVQSANVEIVRQSIHGLYVEQRQQDQLLQVLGNEKELDNFLTQLEEPIFSIQRGDFSGADGGVYDGSFQGLFGFTLFFVIYTITYNVLPILTEKQGGVWDRVILSPVQKWEMYVANLIYSFLTGYLQILIIFSVFKYLVGVDFNERFFLTIVLLIPYVFSIVSLAILITALVKNVRQFNAVIPIISVSMAMIGGAYWPLEIVESKVMLALAKVNPLTYGMEILNGGVVYGYSIEELLFPISILIMMGVLMMGIGIHLMERRHI